MVPSNRRAPPLPPPSGQRAERRPRPVVSERCGRLVSRAKGSRGTASTLGWPVRGWSSRRGSGSAETPAQYWLTLERRMPTVRSSTGWPNSYQRTIFGPSTVGGRGTRGVSEPRREPPHHHAGHVEFVQLDERRQSVRAKGVPHLGRAGLEGADVGPLPPSRHRWGRRCPVRRRHAAPRYGLPRLPSRAARESRGISGPSEGAACRVGSKCKVRFRRLPDLFPEVGGVAPVGDVPGLGSPFSPSSKAGRRGRQSRPANDGPAASSRVEDGQPGKGGGAPRVGNGTDHVLSTGYASPEVIGASRGRRGGSRRGVHRLGDAPKEGLACPLNLLAGLQAGHGVRHRIEPLEGDAASGRTSAPGSDRSFSYGVITRSGGTSGGGARLHPRPRPRRAR